MERKHFKWNASIMQMSTERSVMFLRHKAAVTSPAPCTDLSVQGYHDVNATLGLKSLESERNIRWSLQILLRENMADEAREMHCLRSSLQCPFDD